MYYCKNCKSELPQLSAFCPHCGYKLAEESISKKTPTAAEDEKSSPTHAADLAKRAYGAVRRAVIALILAIVPLLGLGYSLGTVMQRPIRENKRARAYAVAAVILGALTTIAGIFLLVYYL